MGSREFRIVSVKTPELENYWELGGGSSRERGLSHLRGVGSRTRNEKVLSLASFSGDVLWGHSSRTGRVAGPLLTMGGTST